MPVTHASREFSVRDNDYTLEQNFNIYFVIIVYNHYVDRE